MSKVKTIVFLGNFKSPYSSENCYLWTLKYMHYKVIPLQEGEADWFSIVEALRKNKAEMLFWVHTHGWHTPGIEKVLNFCKKHNITTVGYHLDLWLGLERQLDLKTDPYWHIDYFFTVDKLFADYLNADNSKPKADFLPAGICLRDVRRVAPSNEYAKYKVAFVGSGIYHREYPYRQQLIKWLQLTYKNSFVWYGAGSAQGKIYGHDLAQLYATVPVVVGDTLCQGFDYPYYLSDRIFETIGRGGFIIHPYIKGIGELFKLGQELITYTYQDFKQLKELIDYYSDPKHSEEREAIVDKGFKRVYKEHTYYHRLAYILDKINEYRNEQK